MKVFISWSGSLGKALAEALRQWLPGVIQVVKPYYTPDDITKGTRWSAEIAKELEDSQVGIICVTRDSLNAPWVVFEAGALSKNIDKSRVCPILFDLRPTDVQGPLVQFQLAQFEEKEMKRVVKMINEILISTNQDGALDAMVLDSVFEMWWPKIKEKVDTILQSTPHKDKPALRSERELLEEILKLSRVAARSSTPYEISRPPGSSEVIAIIPIFNELVNECNKLGIINLLNNPLRRLWEPLHESLTSSLTSSPDTKFEEAHDGMHVALDMIEGGSLKKRKKMPSRPSNKRANETEEFNTSPVSESESPPD